MNWTVVYQCTVITVRIPEYARNFLTSWETSSFLMALFYGAGCSVIQSWKLPSELLLLQNAQT
jgi:hypothetical protein